MADLAEVRSRAWQTRRAKYGPHGHAGSYSRSAAMCPHCATQRALLIRLYDEGVLSVGQVSRATGLDRVTVRTLADAARQTPDGQEE